MFLSDFSESITEREPLAPHTSFGLGGPARYMARPTNVHELVGILQRCGQQGVDVYKLGQGANLLVADEGVDGVVVRLDSPLFKRIDWGTSDNSPTVKVIAGGGVDMNRLAREAVRRGLAGLECMGGIPGTLGGIIRMNAGGKFGQISDVVRDILVVEPGGEVRTIPREDIGFGYRSSALGDAVVCSATLELRRDDPDELRRRFLEIWDYKRQSQPLSEPSAGCVFKNPPGGSAGALIDRAGLKGRAIGGARVSPKHANFIVAKEGATARDVLDLVDLIRHEVGSRFNVDLDLEIEVWGRRPRQRTERSCASAATR